MADYQRVTNNLLSKALEDLTLEVRRFADSHPAEVAEVVTFLSDLSMKVSALQLPAVTLSEAISCCVRALQFYDRDPSLKEWCDWQPRLNWIESELQALATQTEHSQHADDHTLEQLRAFYRDDLGLPLDATIRYQESLKQKEIAWAKSSLYEAGTSVCTAIEQWPQFTKSSLTTALLAPLAVLKAEQEMPQLLDQICSLWELESKEAFSRQAWQLWGSLLQRIVTASPAHEFKSLMHLAEHKRRPITAGLEICVYDKRCLPGEAVMESFDQTMKAGKSLSAHYAALDINDIKNVMVNNEGNLITLGFKGRPLFYGLVIIHDYNFLERTQSKLAACASLELSPLPVHSWLFMVAGDYAQTIALRAHKVDWYSLFIEVAGDIVLNQNGEDILGIVEMSNPATSSHIRVGFQRLGARTFSSDSGVEAHIVRKPLYDID
jgi:hypothetical protein